MGSWSNTLPGDTTNYLNSEPKNGYDIKENIVKNLRIIVHKMDRVENL